MLDKHPIAGIVPDGVTIHDPEDGAILDTNQQFCEMLGYDREELLGLDFDALHIDEAPYTSSRARDYIREAATQGGVTFEWVDETSGGEAIPVEVHLRQSHADGDLYVLAIVRDISDRKDQERQLQRKNERLAELAGFVSTELRSPLSVIEGSLELLASTGESAHLERCERAITRMEGLMDDLQRLARRGEQISELDWVELNDLAVLCWQTVDTVDAELDVRTDQVIAADDSRLRHLLGNLFRLVIAQAGEDALVRVGSLTPGRGFFIEADDSDISGDTGEDIAGSVGPTDGLEQGLRLSIVRQIVEAHDWNLTVYTGRGSGVRYEVSGVEIRA